MSNTIFLTHTHTFTSQHLCPPGASNPQFLHYCKSNDADFEHKCADVPEAKACDVFRCHSSARNFLEWKYCLGMSSVKIFASLRRNVLNMTWTRPLISSYWPWQNLSLIHIFISLLCLGNLKLVSVYKLETIVLKHSKHLHNDIFKQKSQTTHCIFFFIFVFKNLVYSQWKVEDVKLIVSLNEAAALVCPQAEMVGTISTSAAGILTKQVHQSASNVILIPLVTCGPWLPPFLERGAIPLPFFKGLLPLLLFFPCFEVFPSLLLLHWGKI